MPYVVYKPADGDLTELKAFGLDFVAGEPIEVSESLVGRVLANRFFEKTEKPKQKAASKPDTQKTEGPKQKVLEAVLQNNGVYAVIQDGKTLLDGMSAEDAESFNALSDNDKAAYLA